MIKTDNNGIRKWTSDKRGEESKEIYNIQISTLKEKQKEKREERKKRKPCMLKWIKQKDIVLIWVYKYSMET